MNEQDKQEIVDLYESGLDVLDIVDITGWPTKEVQRALDDLLGMDPELAIDLLVEQRERELLDYDNDFEGYY